MSKFDNGREPLVRIVRRNNINVFEKVFVKLVAVGFAILIILWFLSSVAKTNFNQIWEYIGHGAFDAKNNFLKEMFILLAIAIGLTPAYKMKFWNIGGQGQILVGGLLTATMMLYVPNHSGIIITSLILSILAGGIWAIIPAIFKVKINANETLFTLMMNYVAIQLVAFATHMWNPNAAFQTINPTNQMGYMSGLGNNEYGYIVLISVLLMFALYFYMHYTKHGYEIAVVGESINTAKYAGISTSKVILRTIFLSGAICGLVGFLYVSGCNHTIATTTGGGYGFTGIIVSWAASFNPFIMLLISFGITLFSSGAGGVADATGANQFISQISVGIFLLILIGCEFFINYKFAYNDKITNKITSLKNKIEEKMPKTSAFCKKIKANADGFDAKMNDIIDAFNKTMADLFDKFKEKVAILFSKKKEQNVDKNVENLEVIPINDQIPEIENNEKEEN